MVEMESESSTVSIIDQNEDKQRHFRLGESNLARQHCPNNKESSKQSSTGQPHYSLPTCQNSPLLDICKNNESAHTRSIKAGWLWQSSPRNVAHNPSASFRPCLDKAAGGVSRGDDHRVDVPDDLFDNLCTITGRNLWSSP